MHFYMLYYTASQPLFYPEAGGFSEKVKKSKAIPVKDRGGPWGCETSRFPHFINIG
jgi:hypothetical protein